MEEKEGEPADFSRSTSVYVSSSTSLPSREDASESGRRFFCMGNLGV